MPTGQPRSLWQRIANLIPGFDGYGDAGRRRESDRQAREWLSGQLKLLRSHIDEEIQAAVARGHLDSVGRWDKVRQRVETLTTRLASTANRYERAFHDSSIDDHQLQDLYDLEADILDDVAALVARFQPTGEEAPAADPSELESELRRLETVLAQREELLSRL